MERERRLTLSDGRTLACLDSGDPAGSPVVYIHGFPGSRLEGRLAAGAARRLGLRLLAPDRPGFGASSFKTGRTIGDWAFDVAEMANQLGLERFAVVGASGGGPYALACAARISRRLTGVALLAPLGPIAGTELTRGMIWPNRLALTLAGTLPPLARLAVRIAACWIRRNPARHVAAMMRRAPSADRGVLAELAYRLLFAESTAEALRQGGRGAAWELTLFARPWDISLQEVRMPVRLWQGLADNIVPVAVAGHLAAGLPRAEPRYVPEEGHLSLLVHHLEAALAELRSPGEVTARV